MLFYKRQKLADNFRRGNEIIFEKYIYLRRTSFMQIDSTIIYHKGILKDKKSPRIKNGIETPESQEDTETGV